MALRNVLLNLFNPMNQNGKHKKYFLLVTATLDFLLPLKSWSAQSMQGESGFPRLHALIHQELCAYTFNHDGSNIVVVGSSKCSKIVIRLISIKNLSTFFGEVNNSYITSLAIMLYPKVTLRLFKYIKVFHLLQKCL